MLNDKMQIESLDHILIKDVDSGEVLLDKRGTNVKRDLGKKKTNG